MHNHFKQDLVGLQIYWEEDEEVEYLAPAVLTGSSPYTAATCKLGKKTIHYLYSVKKLEDTPSRLVLEYEENPESWPKGWKLYKGRMTIDFQNGNSRKPIRLSYRFEDGTEIEWPKTKWVYISETAVTKVHPVVTRKRLNTTRLERPLQQALRNYLVSALGRCQVTGTQCITALEACHIVPVKERGNDSIGNALLLRRDIHALFDFGLLHFRLVGDDWMIKVDSGVSDSAYRELDGRSISKGWQLNHPYLVKRAELEEKDT